MGSVHSGVYEYVDVSICKYRGVYVSRDKCTLLRWYKCYDVSFTLLTDWLTDRLKEKTEKKEEKIERKRKKKGVS